VTAGQLVVVAGLELGERNEFISTTTGIIDRTEGDVALDCSQLAAVDEGTLGMLAVLSRNASRRGRRLVLEMSSPRVRSDLDAAGVSHMFDWLV
jgi:anti-anti-sigma regulatory factor